MYFGVRVLHLDYPRRMRESRRRHLRVVDAYVHRTRRPLRFRIQETGGSEMREGERISWQSVNAVCHGVVEKELPSVLLVRMDNGRQMILDKSKTDNLNTNRK